MGNFREFLQFFKSTDFSKALLVGLTVSTPIVLGLYFDQLEVGLAICFGALWTAPSNANGSFRHKRIAILSATVLVVVVSFIGGYLDLPAYILIPILGVIAFSLSYLSVFGFRATLVSFSGLLALVLSFAHEPLLLNTFEYALLVGVGSLWYFLAVVVWYYLNPKGEIEEIFTETYLLTSKFLKIRGQLVEPDSDRKKLLSELNKLQEQLIEKHETLREMLVLNRKKSSHSVYHGKKLLVLAQLVEMLETAISKPVNYSRMDKVFKKHMSYKDGFKELIFKISEQLEKIAYSNRSRNGHSLSIDLKPYLDKILADINQLKTTPKKENLSPYLMLQNLYEYQEKQVELLGKINWILHEAKTEELQFIDEDYARKFIASQDYDPKNLIRNFNLKSSSFRHALRLGVTAMVGYGIGTIFDFQKPYWILLTIIIILRPSYGLTKTRSKDRIIGTLIGATIAFVMVSLFQNIYVYAVLGLVSLVMAFSMLQRNYKTAATFVTLSVIFIYGIMLPDIMQVIQFRVLDTVLGAVLSFVATMVLWPSWSFLNINTNLKSCLVANRNFLDEIASFYNQKEKEPTSLRISRKKAFQETSNLSAAFQEMAQEPKSKQRKINEVYELVTLSHAFLSSLASLSSYIQNHCTTEASEGFKAAIAHIEENLGRATDILAHNGAKDNFSLKHQEKSFESNRSKFNTIAWDFENAVKVGEERNLQEAHLILGQLRWLFTLSSKMLNLALELETEVTDKGRP
ncbi:FUSC family protein [Zobellia alginiliquefaciens]|uniref:FUSC family protein n=1 Tax=Zobellia alginiliquefaciens TaxID=3032586 RepID=UPI0023E447E7|nr:FUSC family membrane protein [Zobellia alginiliquefaciens]